MAATWNAWCNKKSAFLTLAVNVFSCSCECVFFVV